MASLVTSSDKLALTGALGDHFDTFKRDIVVFKEPIKVISNVYSNNNYAGYGESSNPIEFTYVPVSGVYSAIVSYYSDQTPELGDNIGNVIINKGSVKIKVEQSARDFILDGTKTESIKIDGNTFNKYSSEQVQNYLDLYYYIFYLEKTD